MIGIFDSGSGGLSVLAPLRRRAPMADIVYFADIANLPYGEKTTQEIDRLTYAGIHTLITHGATQIINACNTVSAFLTPGHISVFDIEKQNVLEMIGPVLCGTKKKNYKKIALVATRATIRSGAYQRGLDMLGIESFPLVASDLVLAIESGAPEDALRAITDRLVKAMSEAGCDALLLGCTHFPLVRSVFETSLKNINDGITIIDPAEYVVEEAVRRFDLNGEGKTLFVLSKESSVFDNNVMRLLGDQQYDFVSETPRFF